ncbi:MAG: PAS domain-containing protein, partial [Solirubrobacteraceae bacterium]
MEPLGREQLKPAGERGGDARADLSGAGFLMVDRDLRILVAVGDETENDVGRAALMRRVPDVLPAAAWEILEPRYRAALAGAAQSFDYLGVRSGVSYRVRISPIWDAGRVAGVTVLTQDVTTQERAAALRAARDRRINAAFEALEDGVIIFDLGGRIVEANPAASRILGVDLLSRSSLESGWWQRIRPRSADATSRDIGAYAIATGEGARDVQQEIDGPDGIAVLLSVNYLPLRDDAGAVDGLAVSFRDITVKVAAQRRMETL